jgi:hypothetical protein
MKDLKYNHDIGKREVSFLKVRILFHMHKKVPSYWSKLQRFILLYIGLNIESLALVIHVFLHTKQIKIKTSELN